MQLEQNEEKTKKTGLNNKQLYKTYASYFGLCKNENGITNQQEVGDIYIDGCIYRSEENNEEEQPDTTEVLVEANDPYKYNNSLKPVEKELELNRAIEQTKHNKFSKLQQNYCQSKHDWNNNYDISNLVSNKTYKCFKHNHRQYQPVLSHKFKETFYNNENRVADSKTTLKLNANNTTQLNWINFCNKLNKKCTFNQNLSEIQKFYQNQANNCNNINCQKKRHDRSTMHLPRNGSDNGSSPNGNCMKNLLERQLWEQKHQAANKEGISVNRQSNHQCNQHVRRGSCNKMHKNEISNNGSEKDDCCFIMCCQPICCHEKHGYGKRRYSDSSCGRDGERRGSNMQPDNCDCQPCPCEIAEDIAHMQQAHPCNPCSPCCPEFSSKTSSSSDFGENHETSRTGYIPDSCTENMNDCGCSCSCRCPQFVKPPPYCLNSSYRLNYFKKSIPKFRRYHECDNLRLPLC